MFSSPFRSSANQCFDLVGGPLYWYLDLSFEEFCSPPSTNMHWIKTTCEKNSFLGKNCWIFFVTSLGMNCGQFETFLHCSIKSVVIFYYVFLINHLLYFLPCFIYCCSCTYTYTLFVNVYFSNLNHIFVITSFFIFFDCFSSTCSVNLFRITFPI